jgi:hypothetical protein
MANQRRSIFAAQPKERPASELYLPLNPLLIRPWSKGLFALYLKQGQNYVLYTNKGAAYTEAHRRKLNELGAGFVYITKSQYPDFLSYLRDNLHEMLPDGAIPLDLRVDAWRQTLGSLVQDTLTEKQARPLSRPRFQGIRKLIAESMRFLQSAKVMREVLAQTAEGHRLHHHGIGVMALTHFVMQTYRGIDPKLLHKVTVGALLHDLGKAAIPNDVLGKSPDKRSDAEAELYRTHPSKGMGMCISLPLDMETLHCIMFHHEQDNGQGFPAGLNAETTPYYVKVLAMCNLYDSLLRKTPFRDAYDPETALQKLQARRDGHDPEVLKRLVYVLNEAEIVKQQPMEMRTNSSAE